MDQRTFSVKGQRINISGSVGQMVSVVILNPVVVV